MVLSSFCLRGAPKRPLGSRGGGRGSRAHRVATQERYRRGAEAFEGPGRLPGAAPEPPKVRDLPSSGAGPGFAAAAQLPAGGSAPHELAEAVGSHDLGAERGAEPLVLGPKRHGRAIEVLKAMKQR